MLISAQSRQILSSHLYFTIISLLVCPEHLLSLASSLTYCFAIEIRYKSVACKVVASLVHYLFLSVNFWTNVLTLRLFKGLYATRILSHNSNTTFVMHASYAWGSPLILIAVMFCLDSYSVYGLLPVFSTKYCFLAYGWIRILLFTGPIYLQILINIILCNCASVLIMRSASGLKSNISNRRKANIKVLPVVKLFVILSFQWLLLLFTVTNR